MKTSCMAFHLYIELQSVLISYINKIFLIFLYSCETPPLNSSPFHAQVDVIFCYRKCEAFCEKKIDLLYG